MAEIPKPSDIKNVFALNEPQHMVSKLLWEIDSFSRSLSVWTKSDGFPEPLFIVWNAAITASSETAHASALSSAWSNSSSI